MTVDFSPYIPVEPASTEYTSNDFADVINLPEAHQLWSGSSAGVIAVLDDGVDYTNPDIAMNIWINQKEIPETLLDGTPQISALVDTDQDGIITFWDLNDSANWKPNDPKSVVTDHNLNGFIDGGDLLADTDWTNDDDDDDPYPDDLIGIDLRLTRRSDPQFVPNETAVFPQTS